jgi:hypothetical protein
MNTENQHSLWINATRTRYFLIPDDQEIRNGDFILYTLTGDEKKVDPAALESFEIAQEEANSHLQTEMSKAMEQAKSAITNLLTFGTQAGSHKAPSAPSPAANQTQEGLNIISALLGVPPEELQNNPEAAKDSLGKLLLGLKTIVEGATTQESEQIEYLRTQMQTMQERLEEQGIKFEAGLEELPEHLRDWYLSTNHQQNLKEMSSGLREFADQLDQLLAETGGENNNEISLAFLKGLSRVVSNPEDEALQQENKLEQYRQEARKSIEKARQGRKMPSFNFDDLLHQTDNQEGEDQN